MKIWDLLTKSPAELAQAKVGGFFIDLWGKFWQGFDDLALIGFMACLFLWMFSVPKTGKAAWVLVAVYVTVKYTESGIVMLRFSVKIYNTTHLRKNVRNLKQFKRF